MNHLTVRRMKSVGTVRENRCEGGGELLLSSKEMKKKERGHFEYCTDSKVFMLKWHDNAVVTVASNCMTHEPVHSVRRHVKGNANVSLSCLDVTTKAWGALI